MRGVCVLGATGSVGGAALDVVRSRPDAFSVTALAAGGDDEALEKLCREFKPRRAVLADTVAAKRLRLALRGEGVAVRGGGKAVEEEAAAEDCGTVVAAIAGASGAAPVLAAARAGKRVLLANKEALVFCGAMIMRAARESGGAILPIDSEHWGLFELLAGGGDYAKLWLTASGGGARDVPLSQLDAVTPEMALAHPNWTMGAKITVDSATMMNKALEIIEASVLFGAAAERIGVVLHRQSLAHALVEFADGSVKMHISAADMRLPVGRMLFWPEFLPGAGRTPDWRQFSAMEFAEPDAQRYPCLALAYRALSAGGAAPAVLSAANESAVARFLGGGIRFTDIARINAEVLERYGGQLSGDSCRGTVVGGQMGVSPPQPPPSKMGGGLTELREMDGIARRAALEMTL